MRQEEHGLDDGAVDLVLRGGTVLSLDRKDTRASSIAVRHGRVVRLGDDEDIAGLIGRGTTVIDLDGRAVLPGINDSHLHATWLGAMWPTTVMDQMSPGEGDPEHPGGGAADVPGTDGSAHDPHDSVSRLVLSEADRRAAILRANELVASLGITSYTEPGIGPGEDTGASGCFGQEVLETYRALDAERALSARVTVLALFGELDGPSTLQAFTNGVQALDRNSERPEWLRIGGVKIFGDGIPPMFQAWTRHTYPDGSSGGLLVGGADIAEKAANLAEMVRFAHRLGLQVGVHATGDRTIDAVIQAVHDAQGTDGARLGHYIIHGDLVTSVALGRMAALGMGINVQSGIAAKTASWLRGVLGVEATAAAWPIGAALEAGVNLALSSDAPILAPDWRRGIADADAWMGRADDRRARMGALLRAYTVAPARQDGAEGWKGTLEAGKVADLCVLAADPYSLSPDELPDVAIELTVVDGAVVYEGQRAFAG